MQGTNNSLAACTRPLRRITRHASCSVVCPFCGDVRLCVTASSSSIDRDETMATLRTFLYTTLLFLHLSSLSNANTIFTSSYLPDLRPRASSTTTSALDCSQTATGNVSACYPNLNLIPVCCVRVLVCAPSCWTRNHHRRELTNPSSDHASSMSLFCNLVLPPTSAVSAHTPRKSNSRR